MKLTAIALSVAILSGCSTTPQSTQVTYTQACTAYSGAFSAALDARKAGRLTPGQVQSIGRIDAQITPLCTGALPTDTQSAVAKITAAIASMAAIQGAKQ